MGPETVKKNNTQIVCVSPHYWNGFWFRKQHFMYRFSQKGHKIAYIDPSFSMIRRPEIRNSANCSNVFLRTKIEEIENNLFVIEPSRLLPFHTRPVMRTLNFFYTFSRIARALKTRGFENYILWIYSAEHVNILKYFNYSHLVFDITDDLPAYVKKKHKYRYVNKCCRLLIRKSDLVIVTATTLFEKLRGLSSNLYLIPNGYDSELFGGSTMIESLPALKNLQRPIIGFVGVLFPYLDYHLIEYLVRNNVDKTFVFVGPCQDRVRNKWERIIRNKNVIWLGRKEKEEIPAIISNFDVCINPFKIDRLSKSVSPLKVFEYLAMKKPVVSVEMESLRNEEVGKLIHFAKDYDEFNNKIDLALRNSLNEKELECVKKYSWDYLFERLYDVVEKNIL